MPLNDTRLTVPISNEALQLLYYEKKEDF